MHSRSNVLLLSIALLLSAPGIAQESPKLVAAARSQVGVTLSYDPRYERLAYPNGDVPLARGVCTDVVIRAYRKLGADLQSLVHEDIKKAWSSYPKKWQLKKPDRNIDHRRVLNLEVFFERHGSKLADSSNPRDYKPGDVVAWTLPGNLPHIGIVSDKLSAAGVPLVIHNIGAGTQEEDVLFDYPMTGHYRWSPPAR